jgi:Integrase zinc binding domain
MKDYDMELLYHAGKANMVADALSRKSNVSLAVLLTQEERLIEEMGHMQLHVCVSQELAALALARPMPTPTTHMMTTTLMLATVEVRPNLLERIKVVQETDPTCQKHRAETIIGTHGPFVVDKEGVLRLHERVCMPADPSIKEIILSEAHEFGYAIHPGEVKMYQDLKKYFWWPTMKREVTEFVRRCQVCQQVKVGRQKITGLLQPLPRPKGKFESVTMDFVTGFPRAKR